MRAVLNGTVLAESDGTVVVEGNHYFPPDAVRWDHLRRSRLRTLCPWKGVASYHHAVLDQGEVANTAWTYRRPLPFARRIRGYVAFSPGVVVERSPGVDPATPPTIAHEDRRPG